MVGQFERIGSIFAISGTRSLGPTCKLKKTLARLRDLGMTTLNNGQIDSELTTTFL